eukprot:jgi/Chrzof1/2415/Cz11g14160.t1
MDGLAIAMGCAAAVLVCYTVLPFLCSLALAIWRFHTSKIPGPPAKDFILGHAAAHLNDKAPFIFKRWAEKYGKLYKVRMADNFAVVLTDPEVIQSIARKIQKPTKSYSSLELGTFPKDHNILTAPDGPHWKAVRQGITPAFSVANLKQVFPWLCHVTKVAAAKLQDTGPSTSFDISDIAKRITSDVIGQLLYAEDLGAIAYRPSEYLELFQIGITAAHKSLGRPLRLYAIWDPEVRRQNRAINRLDQ